MLADVDNHALECSKMCMAMHVLTEVFAHMTMRNHG